MLKLRKRRGAQMLEFAMLLPIFVLLMVLTVDLGRMVFTQMALQEATYTAARAAAQVGGTNVGGARTAEVVLKEVLENSPGIDYPGGMAGPPRVSPAQCRAADSLVRVSVDYNFEWTVPGIYTLISVATNKPFQITATAVSRCEVVRL